ncbi:hypothetical protein, partial [Candidatus Ichthyocystis hellenicum]|uniref:hypothetical protein n=1 Tax=Candidatus Ichthyocystis hellenicum TaxID=1561003 RepID=UPI001584BBDC
LHGKGRDCLPRRCDLGNRILCGDSVELIVTGNEEVFWGTDGDCILSNLEAVEWRGDCWPEALTCLACLCEGKLDYRVTRGDNFLEGEICRECCLEILKLRCDESGIIVKSPLEETVTAQEFGIEEPCNQSTESEDCCCPWKDVILAVAFIVAFLLLMALVTYILRAKGLI